MWPRRRASDLRSRALALGASIVIHLPLLAFLPKLPAAATEPAVRAGDAVADRSTGRAPLRVRRWFPPPPDSATPAAESTPEPVLTTEPQGQVVEIAPPADSRRPDEAAFLAELDSRVEEESVDPRSRLDRAVTADRFSTEDRTEAVAGPTAADAEPGGGGAGAERGPGGLSFFPERSGRWDFERALSSGGRGSGTPQQLEASGSPSNDWIEEVRRADRTALNAHEFLYASFWNRLKRLVSFYADQCLANARPTSALRSLRYEVILRGLIARDGSLVAIDIDRSSGVPEFDEAIREAFRLAAPFPDPPAGAAAPDGFIHIRNFSFTILLSGAQAELDAIDPRQGVRFPGLETVPR